MASIKVKFRTPTAAGREGTIYYQILHGKSVRRITTDYHLFASEWDEKRRMVCAGRQGGRRPSVASIRERIRQDVELLTKIVRKLDDSGLPYSADDVTGEFNRCAREHTLFNFMERIIAKLRQNGRIRTSETYKTALDSFRKFRRQEDIMIACITSEIMEDYEAWHRSRGVIPNTISFYMRILRAVYNRAVEQGITDNRNPFRHVYTGVDKTVKRALPLAAIRRIKTLGPSLAPALDFARDMFMMSFYLRGMSFVDMVYLRKADLANGHVTYRRRKTGQRLTIAWTKEMQQIIDKYPENPSDYLLPIIRNADADERCTYRNASYSINSNLKKIAGMAGITIPLTLYVARHSWASAAKAKGIPLSIISEGMGHDSETTTRIYLASLETSVVDKANSLILASL